ncbi:hypothetical protein bcere0022_48420 [Bacillus cereus Rock3-44]|nr:hypothetical protein bcere0022_48420 [Bacillus cereus Rock3-44]
MKFRMFKNPKYPFAFDTFSYVQWTHKMIQARGGDPWPKN